MAYFLLGHLLNWLTPLDLKRADNVFRRQHKRKCTKSHLHPSKLQKKRGCFAARRGLIGREREGRRRRGVRLPSCTICFKNDTPPLCCKHACPASEMTYIVSSGALNSTHSLTTCIQHDSQEGMRGLWINHREISRYLPTQCQTPSKTQTDERTDGQRVVVSLSVGYRVAQKV